MINLPNNEDFQEEILKSLKDIFKTKNVKVIEIDEEGNHYSYTKEVEE